MPPKRATARRRAGSGARSDDTEEDLLAQLAKSSPSVNNPDLPAVPARLSFAYGSPVPPLSPGELRTRSRQGLKDLANDLNKPRKSQNRLLDNGKGSGTMNDQGPMTRARRRSVTGDVSPVRQRSKREPTPDQVQLLQTLREEATWSVSPPARETAASTGQSTATPTPPIPHTLSSDSSPALATAARRNFPTLPSGLRLYPSPLLNFGSIAHRDPSLQIQSPANSDQVDNESIISWSVEREVHDDDLQRTRPSKYRESPRGKNITKPPRRASRLAFAHEPIIEEDEPSKDPGVQPDRVSDDQHFARIHSTRVVEPSQHVAVESQPQMSSAPAKTVISRPLHAIFPEETLPPGFIETGDEEPRWRREPWKFPYALLGLFTAAILLTGLVSSAWYFRNQILGDSSGDDFIPPFHQPSPAVSAGPLAPSAPSIPSRASSKDKGDSRKYTPAGLDAQFALLSKQVESLQSRVDGFVVPPPVTVVEPIATYREPPKINFLTIGTGAIIDPHKTNPSAGRQLKLWERALYFLLWESPPRPNPPAAALTSWDDLGDCWCSAPRDGMSQLAVSLGRPIVPEEVVVEHIPKGAAIDSGVAPRQMELWVQYKTDEIGESSMRPQRSSAGDSSPPPCCTSSFTIHETAMETLRIAYRREPETAYSNDELLGPSFYRVGTWEYDIDAKNHVQHFILDAVIDIPAFRVNKVVVRVKSNWGANETCLYRVKLHGHV